MAGKSKAWAKMVRYNKQDVVLLEQVYLKLRGWHNTHPDTSNYRRDWNCPKCGSEEFIRKGFAITTVMKYPRYKCSKCQGWFRGNKSISIRINERMQNIAA